MNEKLVLDLSELTLQDFLTVDIYDKIIRIRKPGREESEPLISKDRFFSTDGLYVQPNKGLKIIPTEMSDQENNSNRHEKLEKLLERVENTHGSVILLIEGYAGCGKSTLVQAILARQVGFVPDYALYNYNIEEQNNAVVFNEKGERIANSSIFNAIKKCFVIQFCKYFNEVKDDFMEMVRKCRENPEFSSVYFLINNERFDDATNCIMKGDVEAADRVLYDLLSTNNDPNCILAVDYFLRLALWKHRIIKSLYICYDNLDAIEDAADLKDFDNKLVAFRDKFDYFLADNSTLFHGEVPHFVILATYRKITSVLANLDTYSEVRADIPGITKKKNIIRIDATSAFSYKEIVNKRKQYFERYFKTYPFLPARTRKVINGEMTKLREWNVLNKNLKIMQDRYSVLWNKNYRTCSLIADILFSDDKYDFNSYVKFIKRLSTFDGYNEQRDDKGNTILCSYFGKSAILLNSVCRVFNTYKIWDDFLKLTHLHLEEPNEYEPSCFDVSLSRLIITLIYNRKTASLEELYSAFCSKDVFSIETLCDSIAKMVARDKAGIWRRPIYYYNECILSCDYKDIRAALYGECQRLKNGTDLEHNYSFQLCDSGAAYVERLMSEYEFYSNRLSNRNRPLYMYGENYSALERNIHNVFCSVSNCCQNMIAFRDEYIKRYNISQEEYLKLDIHPKTKNGASQLHTERIVFSHIAYLNSARLYYINIISQKEMQKRYNALFVHQIRAYLELYQERILSISSDREQVFRKLIAIVMRIEDEEKKENPNEDILFKSIKLNSRY